MPKDFVPEIRILLLANKEGLEGATDKSPLFENLWATLKDRSPNQRWMLLVDPLPDEWLGKVQLGDAARWLSTRGL